MSFWRLYYHLIWATRNREPLIQPDVEERLYACLVDKAAELGVWVYAVNGTENHVHLIVAIPPQLAVDAVVKQLQDASADDLNLLDRPDGPFAWQQAYGAQSVGEQRRPFAEACVRGQKTNHAGNTANAWLQITAACDEGPLDRERPSSPTEAILREPALVYDLDDDWPF